MRRTRYARRSYERSRIAPSDLIDRARRAFEEMGRGALVMLLEDSEPRYVPAEALRTSLAWARVELELLFGVAYDTGRYDAKWEAALVMEQSDSLTVSIAGYGRSEVVESVSWSPVN